MAPYELASECQICGKRFNFYDEKFFHLVMNHRDLDTPYILWGHTTFKSKKDIIAYLKNTGDQNINPNELLMFVRWRVVEKESEGHSPGTDTLLRLGFWR